jgi:hypothetical protein
MGRRNYLIEGVSGTGKTAVCTELQQRGYQAIHDDRELVYRVALLQFGILSDDLTRRNMDLFAAEVPSTRFGM